MKNKDIYIFPTDTVYGIGCSLYNESAQEDIYRIKKRKKDKPFAVLCSTLEQIEDIAFVDETAKVLISKFMPGPLTLILKAKPKTASILGIDTVGVRIPNHVVAVNLLDELGPMTTTSVNKSGQNPLNDYNDILNEFGMDVDNIYKNDYKSSDLSSSVVLINGDVVKILREGAIKESDIKKELNKLEKTVVATDSVKKNN